VDRYDRVRRQTGYDGLQLGVAIPFWYDGTPEVPEVEFGRPSKRAGAAFHLIDMLWAYPEAYALVMAYRNRTDTDDGSIALLEREFSYARGAACGIVIGQEFGLADPYATKTSFGTKGRAAFRQAAEELAATYGDQAQFRGLAVNDLDSYQATPEHVQQ